jgi:hypothetical protein
MRAPDDPDLPGSSGQSTCALPILAPGRPLSGGRTAPGLLSQTPGLGASRRTCDSSGACSAAIPHGTGPRNLASSSARRVLAEAYRLDATAHPPIAKTSCDYKVTTRQESDYKNRSRVTHNCPSMDAVLPDGMTVMRALHWRGRRRTRTAMAAPCRLACLQRAAATTEESQRSGASHDAARRVRSDSEAPADRLEAAVYAVMGPLFGEPCRRRR